MWILCYVNFVAEMMVFKQMESIICFDRIAMMDRFEFYWHANKFNLHFAETDFPGLEHFLVEKKIVTNWLCSICNRIDERDFKILSREKLMRKVKHIVTVSVLFSSKTILIEPINYY